MTPGSTMVERPAGSAAPGPQGFGAFARALVDQLDLGGADLPPELGPDTGLYTDLALDSFQAFRMLIVIEAMAGLDVPPPHPPLIVTPGEAVAYYPQAPTSRPPRGTP